MIYSYFELIIGIILLIIGLGLFIFLTFNDGGIMTLISVVFILPGAALTGMSAHPPIPTEEDVYKGKAKYIETVHVTGNDTVKTYKIKWINN